MSSQRLQRFERKRAAGSPLEPYTAYMEVERVIATARLAGAKPVRAAADDGVASEASDEEDDAGKVAEEAQKGSAAAEDAMETAMEAELLGEEEEAGVEGDAGGKDGGSGARGHGWLVQTHA